MKEKLLALMQNEGLRSSELAEILEINPAGISHILAGRNKPGFDLLQKILRRFPRINPDWLLLDDPNMYRDQAASVAPGSSPQPQTTAAAGTGTSGDLFTTAAKPAMEKSATAPGPQQELQPNAEFTVSGRISSPIARIVIFYEDRSFESYTPEKPLK